jgi:hypothetical protein
LFAAICSATAHPPRPCKERRNVRTPNPKPTQYAPPQRILPVPPKVEEDKEPKLKPQTLNHEYHTCQVWAGASEGRGGQRAQHCSAQNRFQPPTMSGTQHRRRARDSLNGPWCSTPQTHRSRGRLSVAPSSLWMTLTGGPAPSLLRSPGFGV